MATLTLYSDDRVLTITADDRGEFDFSGLPPNSHTLDVSSPGFGLARLPITDKTPERVSVRLEIGEGSGVMVCTEENINDIDTFPILPVSPSYEPRLEKTHLSGTVIGAWVGPLAGTVLLLLQEDTAAPVVHHEEVKIGSSIHVLSSFKQTLVLHTISDNDGNFRFEFQYAADNLDPGWYELKAIHDGYEAGMARFWIARDTLTSLRKFYLFPKILPKGCF